jgi:hypothetical protein
MVVAPQGAYRLEQTDFLRLHRAIMPAVLLAGFVTAKPVVETFPTRGRPRCEVRVKVEGQDDVRTTIFRVIGHDEIMA